MEFGSPFLYFFQAGVLFSIEDVISWLIVANLAILSQTYALFGVFFTGQNKAVAYQKVSGNQVYLFTPFQKIFDQVCRRWENHQRIKVGRKTQLFLIAVIVISVPGMYSHLGLSVYCATKYAIEGFSKV